MGQKDLEESARKVADAAEKQTQTERAKRTWLLAVGKWIADNIVAIGALIVAIIALVRTF